MKKRFQTQIMQYQAAKNITLTLDFFGTTCTVFIDYYHMFYKVYGRTIMNPLHWWYVRNPIAVTSGFFEEVGQV